MAQLKDFSKIIHSGNEIGKVLHQGKTIWQSGPYLAQDSDFVNVNGYWVYRGASKWVVIPTHINGELVTSTQRMFSGHSTYQATPVTKVVLNHSNVTDMSYMFHWAASTTLDLSSFDTSNVTSMYSMFDTSKATTLDLSSFDTSNVTNMGSMFMVSSATTLDLSSFDTSNVTTMAYMFRYSKATTLDLSSFNTSNVTTGTFGMFDGSPATIGYARTQADANKFNASRDKPAGLNFVSPYLAQDSDFVKVNNFWIYRGAELEIEIPTHIEGELVTSTAYMFSGNYTYQATPVTKVVLNHSNVTNMASMFNGSSSTTLDLSSFDTSNVTDMGSMFYSSNATTLDLSNFNTSNVTNMIYMFYRSNATTLDLSNFNTSNVTTMDGMFEHSKATTLDLSSFDTSKVTNMRDMFNNSRATTLDLSNFNTSSVTNMYAMFKYSAATTLDLSSFDTSNVTSMTEMFQGSSATTGYARTQADADKFNASSNKPAGLNFVSPYLAQDSDFVKVNNFWIYRGASKWVEIPTHINGELVTSTSYMFCGDSTYAATPVTKVVLNHSNVTDMNNMFTGSSATTLDLSSFNTSNVSSMRNMFYGSSATTLDLSSFNTSNVSSMRNMFIGSSATTGYARTQADADRFNSSSGKPSELNFVVKPSSDVYLAQDSDFINNVYGQWIYKGTELEIEIPTHINGKLVTSTAGMFAGISDYEATPVTKVVLKHSNVTNMSGMFNSSSATTLDLSDFNTSNVTHMGSMFQNSSATTLDLSSFDTSNVTNMNSMFRDSIVTTGYARTQADADKFNSSSGKPAGLNFVVKSSEGDIPEGYELADDDDFVYFDTTGMGDEAPPSFYLYIGTKEYVAMPEKIDENVLTSYNNMFMDGSSLGQPYTPVRGVYSNNPKIIDMSGMFYWSQATTLDLSSFDTSNVTNMSYMFNGSQATTLDLSNFDTTNVTNMSGMFSWSQATTLDLSSFDTSNVTDMSGMFSYSEATTLDLSSFDTSNANVSSMFYDSQATIGYARTQADADKFNTSSGKPAGLNFVVK